MSDLRLAGGFHPRLLPHYLSDYEFTIRANRKGIRLMTSPKLLISFDEQTTGLRSYQDLTFAEFVRGYFSKRSTSNPVYWTTFVLLAAPKLFIPRHLARIWLGAARAILRQVTATFTKHRKSVSGVPPKNDH
jgi:GT2 family glycosyltransferase